MKILYVHGSAVNTSGGDIEQALRKLGYEAEQYPVLQKEYSFLDDGCVEELLKYIQEHKIEMLISIHFIFNAALAAYKLQMKYIAILWDAPFLTIYNVLGRLDNVWVSTFDKLDRERFIENGVKHVIYQPLSVNKDAVREWNHEIQATLKSQYIHEISFVGSLYENNAYDENIENIPIEMQYYFNSIFEEASFKWDGVNRVYGKTGEEVLKYIHLVNPKFKIPNRHDIPDERYFECLALIRKIANIERIAILNLLAEKYSVTLYTGSKKAAEEKLQNIHIGPPVEYGKASALVFAGSKINLNISLKGIEGGTPLRIMDIMGAGGFVMSTYCEETAELFIEDKEIVMFRSPEELMEKVDYYLKHDRERRRIAQAGYDKVINCYTYEKKLGQLLEWAEKDFEFRDQ